MATRSVASIMGVKGSSIKLLDETRRKLIFSSTYGLSENYLAKGTIDIEKSPSTGELSRAPLWPWDGLMKRTTSVPEDVKKEGIASMVCLPLRVEKMPWESSACTAKFPMTSARTTSSSFPF